MLPSEVKCVGLRIFETSAVVMGKALSSSWYCIVPHKVLSWSLKFFRYVYNSLCFEPSKI